MARFIRSRKKTKGLPPGSLVFVGDYVVKNVKVTLIDYNEEQLVEKNIENIEDCLPYLQNKKNVTWINIEGLSDTKLVERIGVMFDINPLWLEDVLDTDHRPKIEELENLLFILCKAVSSSPVSTQFITFEQVSIFLGDHFVVSFQERPGDVFSYVNQRLKQGKRKLMSSGADYLFYALVDAIADEYYVTLESLGERIEQLEQKISEAKDARISNQFLSLKNDILYFKKSAVPFRDAIDKICLSEREDVQPKTRKYLQDAHQHMAHVCDVIDHYLESLSSSFEAYRGIVNYRLTETMKILTIFTAVFIPLTFITGIYGMNFAHIPELSWEYGYAFAWGVILTTGAGLLWFFRRKRWL